MLLLFLNSYFDVNNGIHPNKYYLQKKHSKTTVNFFLKTDQIVTTSTTITKSN